MSTLWHRIRTDWRIRKPGVALAVIAALVLAIMPRGVEIQSDGLLSISLSTVRASDTGIVDYLELAPKDDGGELLGTADPIYAVVNKSGTCERYGVVQVRLDLCLAPGAYRYDDPRFYVVDESSAAYIAGYLGKVDKEGTPRDQTDYDKWYESLPRKWLEQRVFHTHFIYLDPYEYSDAAIQAAMALHLPNFYAAWCADLDQEIHGMRHGWAVDTRIAPPRYEDAERKADCDSVVDSIALVAFDSRGMVEGELYPATDIDVGSAADNRTSYISLSSTIVSGDNPANDSGHIDTVECWLQRADAGNIVRVGTFSASSNTLTCREGQQLGELSAGSKQTVSGLSLDVVTGDYIGLDETGGVTTYLDLAATDGLMHWYKSGDYCDTNDTATFSTNANRIVSIYGTGETPPPPVAITNTGDTYNFGVVKVGQTYNSTLDYFNLTNTGGVAVNVTIGATDATNATAGTDNWTLADNATPGIDTFGLKAGLSGSDFTIIVKKSATYNDLVANLAAGNSQPWGIKLYTPTEINNGDPKRSTITLTAAAA